MGGERYEQLDLLDLLRWAETYSYPRYAVVGDDDDEERDEH